MWLFILDREEASDTALGRLGKRKRGQGMAVKFEAPPACRVIAFGAVLALLSGSSWARQDQTAPVRFGSKSIRLGMDESEVRKIAGVPTREVELTNKFGAHLGKKLVYKTDGYNKRTVVVIVDDTDGVARLNECMGVKADECD